MNTTKFFTAIVNANVINPNPSAPRYFLEKKGAQVVFYYDDSTPIKVIENIKNGVCFPICYKTQNQTWVKSFTLIAEGEVGEQDYESEQDF